MPCIDDDSTAKCLSYKNLHDDDVSSMVNGHSDMEKESGARNEKKGDAEKNTPQGPPPVGYFQLFRFASLFDKILLVLGILAAFLGGLTMPAMIILYGYLTDAFVCHAMLPNPCVTATNVTLEVNMTTNSNQSSTLCDSSNPSHFVPPHWDPVNWVEDNSVDDNWVA